MVDTRDTSGTGQQQFVVSYRDRLYLTSVVTERDANDPELQAAVQQAGEIGTAAPYYGDAGGSVQTKSMQGAEAFADINRTDMAAPSTSADIDHT